MQYTDLITYTKDSLAFMAEVEAKFPDKIVRDEETQAAIGVIADKTPTVRNTTTGETVAVVRVDAETLADIKTLTTLTILAEVPAYGDLLAAMTKTSRKLYDGVHDQTPVAVLDDKGKPMLDANGVAVMYTPPALIGAFI